MNLRERLKSAITFDFYAARDIYYEGSFPYGSKVDRRSMPETNSIPLRSAMKQWRNEAVWTRLRHDSDPPSHHHIQYYFVVIYFVLGPRLTLRQCLQQTTDVRSASGSSALVVRFPSFQPSLSSSSPFYSMFLHYHCHLDVNSHFHFVDIVVGINK